MNIDFKVVKYEMSLSYDIYGDVFNQMIRVPITVLNTIDGNRIIVQDLELDNIRIILKNRLECVVQKKRLKH